MNSTIFFIKYLQSNAISKSDSINIIIALNNTNFNRNDTLNLKLRIINKSSDDIISIIPPQITFNAGVEIYDAKGRFVNSNARITPRIFGKKYTIKRNGIISTYLFDNLNKWYSFSPGSYEVNMFLYWTQEENNKENNYYSVSNDIDFSIN